MTTTQAADPVSHFDTFRASPFDVARCRKAADELAKSPDTARVASMAREFIHEKQPDEVRAWGMNVLERVPDKASFKFLTEFINSVTDPGRRRRAKYSRMYALKALDAIASTESQRRELGYLLEERWSDENEDTLPRAFAAALASGRATTRHAFSSRRCSSRSARATGTRS